MTELNDHNPNTVPVESLEDLELERTWRRSLYTLWITQIISLTSFGFGIPFLPFYVQELGVTDPASIKFFAGILASAPAITMAAMSPVWGALSDRFGQKLMIQRAMLAATILIAAMGLVTGPWQLFSLRLLQGVFTGTVTAASAFVAVNTPNRHMSYAIGFLSSSTFIGYSVGPLLGGKIAELLGYRVSFFIGGTLMFVGFLLVTFLLKERKKHRSKLGQARKTSFREVLTFAIMMILLMLFFHRITRSIFSSFVPLYITEFFGIKEGSVGLTGYLNGGVGLMTAISAVLISRIADKHSKTKMIRIMLVLGAIAATVSALMTQFWGFFVSYIALFFFLGGIEPMLTAEAAKQTHPNNRGTLMGVLGLVGSLGWIVSPMIGAYLSIEIGMTPILWVMVGLIAANFCFSFLIKTSNQE